MEIHFQPKNGSFKTILESEISNEEWKEIFVASAWARIAAIDAIFSPLKTFLETGRKVRIVIGVDLQHTSTEALNRLLELKEFGDLEVRIFHSEGSVTFHPKLYYFSGRESSKIWVGSNNLTSGGIFNNLETSLATEIDSEETNLEKLNEFIGLTTDPNSDCVMELTPENIQVLVENGYVVSETKISDRTRPKVKSEGDNAGNVTTPLFGRLKSRLPRRVARKSATKKVPQVTLPPETASGSQSNSDTSILIMRVRKARGTQVQIPKRLIEKFQYFENMEIIHGKTRSKHQINPAMARGVINTYKVEIPETDEIEDPLIIFENDNDEVTFSVYDRNTTEGIRLMKILEVGRTTVPATTTLTKPQTPESSTWYRFY